MSHEIANAKKEIDYECEVDSGAIEDRIASVRLRMMREQPFYSSLALRLNYVEEPKIPTAAVDGKNFFYNKHFINALDDRELLFVTVHEILHIVMKHLTRRGKRNPELWNQAADYVINYIIHRDKIGRFPDIGGLLDEKYADMSTDAVYHALEEEQEKNGGGGSGGKNFDVHVTVNQDGSGEKSDNQNGEGGGETQIDDDGQMSKSMTEDEMNEMEDDVVSAVMAAVKAAQSTGAGSVPGEVQRLIDDFLEPRVDWRSFLSETAVSQVRSDYDRRKPNRRFPIHQFGVVLPSLKKDKHVEFSLAIDTSGSISVDMLREFVSEVRGIVESFPSFEINIWCFDTKVYSHEKFDQDNIDDIEYYDIKGGGGTDFMANWRYMEKVEHVPKTLIMLTDGYPFGEWGDEEYCETIFLIHEQSAISQKIKAPFGMTLYFDDFE